jgi:hypothetical protein
MLEFISAIAVAAIGGLAFLAYREPLIYRHLQKALMYLLYVTLAFAMIWNVSNTMARHAVAETLMGNPNYEKVTAAIDSVLIAFSWAIIGFAVSATYLIFLGWLSESVEKLRTSSSPSASEKSD